MKYVCESAQVHAVQDVAIPSYLQYISSYGDCLSSVMLHGL